MREFDRLPQVLRAWVTQAVLPWRPRSVLRAYNTALARTGDQGRALDELRRLELCSWRKTPQERQSCDQHPVIMGSVANLPQTVRAIVDMYLVKPAASSCTKVVLALPK